MEFTLDESMSKIEDFNLKKQQKISCFMSFDVKLTTQ